MVTLMRVLVLILHVCLSLPDSNSKRLRTRWGGGGGGGPKGRVHNLLMQLFTLGSSKIKVFETCFFDIVTT